MVGTIAALVALLAASTAQADWQFTRRGMSPDELVDLGQGMIRASRGDSTPNGSGTTMAVDADRVLTSAYNAEGVKYHALYHKADRLFLVALIPQSKEDGFKTSKPLDATYGPADREERMGRDEAYVGGCIVRRRWRDREMAILLPSVDPEFSCPDSGSADRRFRAATPRLEGEGETTMSLRLCGPWAEGQKE
jgi:hypothetical protein